MIAIVDYGAGNLFSVQNALDYLGIKSVVTSEKSVLEQADKIILPGVGAFPVAMQMLGKTNLIDTLKEQASKKPLLGICLGMQMLFDESYEFSKTAGLGFIEGKVDKIPDMGLKIPHMGWNELVIDKESPLMHGIKQGDCVYFVHSFMATTSKENIVAHCEYGCDVVALVSKGNVYGAQFHPEKSGDVGLKIFKNFCNL